MTDSEADALLTSAGPRLQTFTETALQDVPRSRRGQCRKCAAHLWNVNFLDSMAEVPYGGSLKSHVKHYRNSAVAECQAAGILPSGISWLIVRWLVLPFLEKLIADWLSGE